MELKQCNKLMDCLNCPSLGGNMFYYLRLLNGYSFQQYRFRDNCILFIFRGKIRINGLHFSDIEVNDLQQIVIPIGVELDIHILADTDCLVYRFHEPPILCEEQYNNILSASYHEKNGKLLDMLPTILNFAEAMVGHLQKGLLCQKFLDIKQKELVFLINSYYSPTELLPFLFPVLKNMNHFRCFILQNYYKVKTVEELAILGRYSIINFRRLFKEEFGEPAYQWMLRQKLEHIHYDLTHRQFSISEIADKYQFESLPQFSNFCKKYLGASPRELQSRQLIPNEAV